MKMSKSFITLSLISCLLFTFLSVKVNAQSVAPYTGIDYATDYTNPAEGGPCDMTTINASIGDADFVNGAAEVPLGWSFSGTWASGETYVNGPGNEVLLVSLHTYTESWNVALRLSDGTTTTFLPYDLTIVTSNGVGTLAVCGGEAAGPFDYERPSQELDFADYTIPPGEGVIGIVFEPFSDGAGNPDPHGVLILEGTPIDEPCTGEVPVADFEFLVGGVSSNDGATGACITTPIEFNDLSTIGGGGSITDWNWNFGDGGTSTDENPTHTFAAAGTYTVTLTVISDGGCEATYTFPIEMTNGLALDITFNEPTCFGFSDGSVTVSVLDGVGDLIFTITDVAGTTLNEDNSNTANTLGTGWYYINVDDDSDCSGIDSVFLDQPGELDIEITVEDPACYGFETGTAVVTDVINYTGDYDAISYIWSPNPGGNSGIGEDSTWAMGVGEYTITINDENGCSKTFEFMVNQPDSLMLTEFDTEPAYCRLYGYQSGNGVVFGGAAGGTADYTYLWTNLDNGETEVTTTWGGLNPGNYEFTVTDAQGCILTRALFLDSLNPQAAFTVVSDQLNADCQGTASVEVAFENNSLYFANPNIADSDSSFFWNLNSPDGNWIFTEDYNFVPDTTYGPRGESYIIDVCLVVLNKNGCSDTLCKPIQVFEPTKLTNINVFTPNGDDFNDVFTFNKKSASINEFYCVIVNRWGVVVKEFNAITDTWDGTDANGDPVPSGVYFYKYNAVTDNNVKIDNQGNITLVR